MKRRSKIVLLALFLFVNLTVSVAQIDTAFWFGTPWITQGHAQKIPLALQVSTFSNTTTVRVRQPAGTYDTTFTVPPNTNFTKSLSHVVGIIETIPANTALNRGLKISSDFPITVVYDNITVTNNPETYSMKGQNALGLEFVCPFQTHRNNGGYTPTPKSQIIIVATDYNTVVWITPKCPVIGHPANITYSVALSYGQSYNIENVTNLSSVPGQNLSGTIIVSNKPIAVTVADDSVSGVSGCFDLMGDQLVPVDIVGTEYIVNKGGLNAAQFEGPYIVATENLTQITITDAAVTTTLMNKGDTYFYKLINPLTHILATKPVYVLHESGFGCELGEAILPPLNCAGSNQVAFTRNNGQPFYLNILCKTGSETTFTLNGSSTLVPASAFSVVPGTSGAYMGAQIGSFSTAQIPVLSAQLLSNNTDVFALGIFHGGATSGALYHYMSSFLRRTTVKTQTVTPYCVGSGLPINLTGTVSGGAITGVWTVANGSGSFGAYTSTVNTISTSYNLSNNDTLLTSIKFYLTSTGNCTPKVDSITVPIVQRPKVFIGTGTTICKNNVVPIVLTGTITNALGGTWSGGTGFFAPGINITYTPTAADLAAGSLVLTLSSVGGCTTTARTLTVNFVNPPTIAGIDDNVCTNTQTITLNASVTGSTLNPTWTTSNGTGLFLPSNQTITPTYQLSQSDYSLTAINMTVTLPPTGPCASVSDVIQLTMRPAPLAIAPADFTVCANAGLINLNGSIGGSASTGTWTTINGTGAFNPPPAPPVSTYTMSFSDLSVGTLTYVLTTDPGTYNCPNDTDTLKIAVLAAPVVAVNSNAAVCENAPVALTGTVTGYTNTGIWSSTGTGAFTPTNTSLGGQYFPSAGDVSNGTVTLTLLSTNNQGCPAQSASFVAKFVKAPQSLFTASAVRCQDSIITFINGSQANGTSVFLTQWNFGTAPSNSIQSTTSGNANYTYTNSGSYIITLTVQGTSPPPESIPCFDTVSRRITVNSLPIPNFTYLNACQGLPAQFRDSSIVLPGNIVAWNWNFGDGSVNSFTRNPVHTYTTAGTYNVLLTAVSNNSCAASITKTVNINQQPLAQFGMTNDPTVALEPVYFSDFSAPTGSISSWLWSFGDEGSGEGPSPTHVYQNAGSYIITLTVFDNNGCTDTVSKEIQVQVLPQVPTAFTPNKDNNNDLLFVKGGPFEKMTFRVYNNWGELLFETNDQKTGWDGTKNGKDQPVGVYVWTLVVDMYNNRQVKKNGDVTIIR